MYTREPKADDTATLLQPYLGYRRTEIIITPNLDQFMDLIGKAPETKDHSAEF